MPFLTAIHLKSVYGGLKGFHYPGAVARNSGPGFGYVALDDDNIRGLCVV